MKKITAAIGIMLSILLTACGANSTAQTGTAPAGTRPGTVDGTVTESRLNTALYTALVQEGPGDFIISPYSMKDAFSILYPAAEGRARDEIEGIFGFKDGSTVCRDIDNAMIYDGKTGVKAVNKAYVNTANIKPEDLHPEVLDADLFEITEFDHCCAACS